MKQEAYLVFDIGTGNSRAAVLTTSGEILSMAKENSIVYTDQRVDGAQYFEPAQWREILLRLAKEAIQKAGEVDITAVTASSLREGIVLLDEHGEAVVGFTNADRRGEPYMKNLDWTRIRELTGLEPSPISSAVKILGAMHLDPELWKRTKYFTSISDWVGYVFTGRCVWERAQAMQSALYDGRREEWSAQLCRLLGVDASKLPPLAAAGSVLGNINEELIQELRLSSRAVFVVGTADTQAALASIGAETGEIVIVSGTTSPVVKLVEDFQVHSKTWISPTAKGGQYMLEVNTASCGINLQRFKDLMLADVTYEELNDDAARRGMPKRGLPGCLACFSPGMHLDKTTPDGGFVLRSPISVDLKRYDFFHALALNVAMSITLCLQRLKALAGFDRDYLIGCGGGFASPVIGQCVADLIGMPIRIFENYREATVYGCHALCCQAFGRELPSKRLMKELRPDASEELERYFKQWTSCRGKFQEMDF